MQLSDAEWLVMNTVWDQQPVEASDVIAALAPVKEWSEATTKTLLHRLVKKQALAVEKIGKKYRYTASVTRAQCVRQASRSFLDRIFGGRAVPALLHFVQTSRLTEAELEELRALLDSKLSERRKPRP